MSPRNKKLDKDKNRDMERGVTASPIVSPDEAGLREGALGVPKVGDLDTAELTPEERKHKAKKDVDFGCPPR
ncbi:MAG: hypothetical protein IBX71_02475 [Candidatus Desulforudis sp.]|nr:hypothetical protein [Desulforudis sp.]